MNFYKRIWFVVVHGAHPSGRLIYSSQPGISQMIWKSTKYIGVGVAWDSNGKVVIVAHYKPAGNIAGYFAENVSVIDPIKHAGSTVTVPSKSRVTE